MTDDPDGDVTDPEKSFQVYVNSPRWRTLRHDTIILKPGPEAKKVVELRYFGRPENDRISKRTLRFRTFDLTKQTDDESEASEVKPKSFYCEDDEIDGLVGFLQADVGRSGRYRMINVDSPKAALLDLLEASNIEPSVIIDSLLENYDLQQLLNVLTSSDAGAVAAQTAVVRRRRELVAELRALVDDPFANETDAQKLIGKAHWLFGGRYVGVADRREFIPLDTYDIPLLGADGTLHIVELKGPVIKGLIRQHRNHWIVGSAVHEATAQALNYLRLLDELGLGVSKMYENEQGQRYDMSRVFATVVIGHSDHYRPEGAEREVVARTLRQYNAHLSRVEVITYDQLVSTAERALAFENEFGAASGTTSERADEPVPDDDWEPAVDPWSDDDDSPF